MKIENRRNREPKKLSVPATEIELFLLPFISGNWKGANALFGVRYGSVVLESWRRAGLVVGLLERLAQLDGRLVDLAA